MSGKVKNKKVSDYQFDPRNINKGSEYGMSLLEKSIMEVGMGRSALADKNGVLIAGNKTMEKAGGLGFEDVIEVETTGRQIVVVKRMDLDINSEAGAKMKILDNTVSAKNYIEDAQVAEAICEEYKLEAAQFGLGENKSKQAEEDDYEIPDEIKTDIVLGDLFEIGQHRLLCGDSTKAEDVAKLLGSDKPNLMVTDPPYGVNYEPTWRDEAGGQFGDGKTKMRNKVGNDNRADWGAAWALFPGGIAYVWHSAVHASVVAKSLTENKFKIRAQIIWVKPHFIMSRGDYHWQHEPCWYGVRERGNWTGDRSQTTVWEIAGMNPAGRSRVAGDENKTIHGTQKPIECMARPIKNNSIKSDFVYDPFIGSGTTIVACEQMERRCLAMDNDPVCCQIVIDRMLKLNPAIEIKRNGLAYKRMEAA